MHFRWSRRKFALETIPNYAAQVAILICGAVQEMQSQIVMFLEALPRIDRCDAVQSGVHIGGIVLEVRHLMSQVGSRSAR